MPVVERTVHDHLGRTNGLGRLERLKKASLNHRPDFGISRADVETVENGPWMPMRPP